MGREIAKVGLSMDNGKGDCGYAHIMVIGVKPDTVGLVFSIVSLPLLFSLFELTIEQCTMKKKRGAKAKIGKST